MTEQPEEFKCDHCGAVDPVGGLTATRRYSVDHPSVPDARLCEVCMNTLCVNPWLVGMNADREAVDRAMIANIIRKDIQRIFRRLAGVTS